MNSLLYISTVLIWGTTWLAIYFQLGEIPLLLSVFYRFALATVLFLPLMFLFGKLQKTTARDHFFMLLQGACLFSFNFICFYTATQYAASGLISVIFSLATLYNAVNNRILYREAITRRVIVAAIIGVFGLLLLFWNEIISSGWSVKTLGGLGLAALGTYFFSLGNMISKRHSLNGLNPLTSNAWGMAYGSLILAGLLAITQTPIVIPTDSRYIMALVYLAVFGSIIGFTTYLMLVARIGANQAAYATVLFPVIALMLSSIFEGYVWNLPSYIGLGLIIIGNLIMTGKIGKTLFGRA